MILKGGTEYGILHADSFCTWSDRFYFQHQRSQEKTEYRPVCSFDHPCDGLYGGLSISAFQRRTQVDENSSTDRCDLFFHHLHQVLFNWEMIGFVLL